MNKENVKKNVVYDPELRVEAYRFQGVMQQFPKHFHDYYVIGLIENGSRMLSCRDRLYRLRPGQILLFNPGDSHSCENINMEELNYRGLNISKPVMLEMAGEITGENELPGFFENVVEDDEAAYYLRYLHKSVMYGYGEFDREETLIFLISILMERYGRSFAACIPECTEEIVKACSFIEENYESHISLDQICDQAALSKSTLLRAFTRYKGVTPYSYLINIRISKAKALIERGMTPAEAAVRTGFSDQSHFTNCFSKFIGISPGAYRGIFLK